MKILFLCHRLPYPPKRGGKIRPFNMIRHLSRNHDVTVATLARSKAELLEGQELRNYCRELLVGLIPPSVAWSRFGLYGVTTYPSTFAYFYSPWLAREIRGRLRTDRFEAIVVHSACMGPYVAAHHGCRKIMDFGDADSEKWFEYARRAPFPLSVAFRYEAAKVRLWERRLGQLFDACSVIAEGERQALASFIGTPIDIIPNGVDLEYFKPMRSQSQYDPRRLVFTGNMSYRPNVDAVHYLVNGILSRISARVSDIQLFVVGMDPAPSVRRLTDGHRVIVTGRVDDVRPYLEDAAVAVAPLRIGRGLQNKVLEAMAMRVPVVASPVAAAGIAATRGRDILVAADPETFASGVVSLMSNPALRQRYATAGRAYVEQHHDWQHVLRRLEHFVLNVASPSVACR